MDERRWTTGGDDEDGHLVGVDQPPTHEVMSSTVEVEVLDTETGR